METLWIVEIEISVTDLVGILFVDAESSVTDVILDIDGDNLVKTEPSVKDVVSDGGTVGICGLELCAL